MSQRIRIPSLVITLVLAVAAASRAAAPVVRVEPILQLLATIPAGISGALARNASSRLQNLPAALQQDLLSSLDARIGPELTPDSLSKALREEFLKARQDFREIQEHDAWYKKQDPKVRTSNIVNDRDDYAMASDLLQNRRLSLSPSHEKTLRALMEDLGARRRELDSQLLEVSWRLMRDQQDRLPSQLLPSSTQNTNAAKAKPADTRMQARQAAAGAVLRLVREAIMTKDRDGKTIMAIAGDEILTEPERFSDQNVFILETESQKRKDLAAAAMDLQKHIVLSLAQNESLDRPLFFTAVDKKIKAILKSYSQIRTDFHAEKAQRVQSALQQAQEAAARLKSKGDERPSVPVVRAPARPSLHPEVNKLAAIFKATADRAAIQAALAQTKDLLLHYKRNKLSHADRRRLISFLRVWGRPSASSRQPATAKLPLTVRDYDQDPGFPNIDEKKNRMSALARHSGEFITKGGNGISGPQSHEPGKREISAAADNLIQDADILGRQFHLIREPYAGEPPPSEDAIERLRNDIMERDGAIYNLAQQAHALLRDYIQMVSKDKKLADRRDELIATAVKFQSMLRRWRDVKIPYF